MTIAHISRFYLVGTTECFTDDCFVFQIFYLCYTVRFSLALSDPLLAVYDSTDAGWYERDILFR